LEGEEEKKQVEQKRKKEEQLTLIGRWPSVGSSINSIDLRLQKPKRGTQAENNNGKLYVIQWTENMDLLYR